LKISIIIVNYYTAGHLDACIDSINKYEEGVDKEFIIVDNNSDDINKEKIKLLSEKHKNVKPIFLNSNKGFAFANNRGAELCEGDYFLILNPDVIFTEGVMLTLTDYLKDEKTGAMGAKLYGEDGELQKKYYQKYPSVLQYILFYSIFSKPFVNSGRLIKKHLEKEISEKELVVVPQIPGAFVFLRKEIYEEFNGFNESYFLFFEDVDLSYRIAKKYKLYITDFKVMHIGASSMMIDTNYKIYGYFILSLLVFFKNNYCKPKYFFLKFLVFTNAILKIIVENLKKLYGGSHPDVIKVHKYILKNL
jgi:N-acetylglucosaminyl-diphospho-decaprenol L-rhamnosyltransferase